MSETTRAGLRKLLASRYAYLVRRLERVTGSKDSAADVLHETWLRLDNANVSTQVGNADAYLLGMASNVAIDQHRRERRHLHEDDADVLLELPDELADPERIVAARRKVDALKEVLRGLTPRRRAILIAARVDGLLNREIAERFGISLRLVESELSAAMKYCLQRMQEEGDSYPGSRGGPRKF
ncbi:RNA polymerase, sigma-24 subunit, ECF subfamily [Burkholderia sp. lig30]|jgi:RNA polymerase sigma-70 factor (ECF subfamily)|uniref:RNA polymerase sigma factor n=1 Tax=Burkholderia sp. lig30 TaxID=1192124 RepID=UPI000461B55D|nr:RNA polymerase sigma factor [Burkholderia sp. lig30]KDB08118.1 RNA polymerase, sigma-24 subunit, ECF subfamily [Burkholderia sp. lig30]